MRVTAVYTYPIKGCFRTEHREAAVEPWGLAGDRRFLVVDDADVMLTQREEPRMVRVKPELRGDRLTLRAAGAADLTVAVTAGESVDVKVFADVVRASRVPAAEAWLGTVLGRPARLLWLDDPTVLPSKAGFSRPDDRLTFADGFPLMLANARSLDMLNDWLVEADSPEWPLPMSRFRPNLVVDGAPAWAEDVWTGRRVRVGSVWFRAPRQMPRCVVTTTDQDTGERGREPLRTLARHRNIERSLLFGLCLIPDELGTVAVGDGVIVE